MVFKIIFFKFYLNITSFKTSNIVYKIIINYFQNKTLNFFNNFKLKIIATNTKNKTKHELAAYYGFNEDQIGSQYLKNGLYIQYMNL